jgi:hypothetical protein
VRADAPSSLGTTFAPFDKVGRTAAPDTDKPRVAIGFWTRKTFRRGKRVEFALCVRDITKDAISASKRTFRLTLSPSFCCFFVWEFLERAPMRDRPHTRKAVRKML